MYVFLGIGTAFAVLSDPDKKRRYEEFGETLGPAQRHTRHYSDVEREFEGLTSFHFLQSFLQTELWIVYNSTCVAMNVWIITSKAFLALGILGYWNTKPLQIVCLRNLVLDSINKAPIKWLFFISL